MCIRDRAQGQGGYANVFRDKGFMLFVSMMSIGLIAPSIMWILMPVYSKTNFGIPENLYGWIPVSYTHLRAHETVLDLVCRLLLEKKQDLLHNIT